MESEEQHVLPLTRTRFIGVFRSKSDVADAVSREQAVTEQAEVCERLLKSVKKEVKQIMEEAVTRKFVHEESSSITSLCAAVDSCLSYGLRRRALGLFKTHSTTALLQKIAKSFPPAYEVVQIVQRIEHIQDGNKRSSSSGDSITHTPQRNAIGKHPAASVRYLWLRIALFEKHLTKIVDYLVENASKYYEKDALVVDPVSGQILASLLVGPCALDYTRMKTQDHFWTDPPADELVQRHRLSNFMKPSQKNSHPTPSTSPSISKRPTLSYRRAAGSSSEDSVTRYHSVGSLGSSTGPSQARDYVESLHQNPRSTLIYGKNNVTMHPHDCPEPLRGYLSLHHEPSAPGLVLKWTPNQLMNGSNGSSSSTSNPTMSNLTEGTAHSIYWEHAIKVKLSEVVYLHCHQKADEGGSLVLVGQDGVQRSPIIFPTGDSHLLQFLTCLGGALLPHSRLDPPLCTQANQSGGTAQPKLKGQSICSSRDHDLVFRVIHGGHKPAAVVKQASGSTSSESVEESEVDGVESNVKKKRCEHSPTRDCSTNGGETLEALCSTMRKQILSRAFYGWLAYCRHLRTVRIHLSGLVHHNIVPSTEEKLTPERWDQLVNIDGSIRDPQEVFRLVYFGGLEPNLRKKVWPYLLGHYKMSYTYEQRKEKDDKTHVSFESAMSEWLAAEAIVRQRDKETAAALRLSSGGSTTQCSEMPLAVQMSSDNNDVFDDEPGNETNLVQHSGDEVVFTGEIGSNLNTFSYPEEDYCCHDDLHHFPKSLSHNELIVDPHSECPSPASSSGAAFTSDLLDLFELNIHRIDKDVRRCDRNIDYFVSNDHLDKLRNVMCTYVWEHLDVGYVQGMCDLAAPLLVIFDDEVMTYSCFRELMTRMTANFPQGNAMDQHFANMRSLIQILDGEIFALMQQNGDYTHFYFCYRWFLLDFKRELVYDDVFKVWETIWAAQHVASSSFVLFIALGMVKYYREIIIENRMDFTDIIRFFNEMAERHEIKAVLRKARQLVLEIQNLIDTSK